MSKDLKIPLLLDFYGELLTEKQKNTIELYYNNDLSLGEISEHLDITRQGVRDSIKRGEKILYDMEDKLRLVSRFEKVNEKLEVIENSIKEIEKNNNKHIFSPELTKELIKIKQHINDINEII